MPRQQLIKIRTGSTAPTAADFQTSEPAWDGTNKKLYVKAADGTMVAIGGSGPTSQYSSSIVSVTALDIDCSAGNYFIKTINGNSTFTFSNAPASCAYGFTLELTHTSGTVTWPATVKWNKDTAPTLTAGRTHLFMFVTDDSGSRWRGAALVDYIN